MSAPNINDDNNSSRRFSDFGGKSFDDSSVGRNISSFAVVLFCYFLQELFTSIDISAEYQYQYRGVSVEPSFSNGKYQLFVLKVKYKGGILLYCCHMATCCFGFVDSLIIPSLIFLCISC